MKKAFILIISSLSCFANYVCDPCNPCDEKDPCDSCRTCDPCYVPCVKIKKSPKPCIEAYNAPYKIELACPWDTYASISYILWEAQMDNTQYGDVQTEVVDIFDEPQSNTTVCRDRLDVDQTYTSGFKAGLGFMCNSDFWDFYLGYTYLRSCESRRTSVADTAYDTDGTLTTTKYINGYFFTGCENQSALLGENQNFIPFKGSGKWSVDLDVGDAEFGRQYYVGKCLLFHPFASLRLAFIRQTYLAKYSGPIAVSVNEAFNNPSNDNGNFTFQNTSTVDSWGLGPRAGLDMSWMFCGNFRAFSDFEASLLYTRYYKQKTNAQCQFFDGDDTLVAQSVNKAEEKNTYCTLRPVTEFTLGLAWGCDFDCSRWFFDLSVGYTFNIFWDQNLFYENSREYVRNVSTAGLGTVMEKTNNLLSVKGGNLTFQGLTITLDMHF